MSVHKDSTDKVLSLLKGKALPKSQHRGEPMLDFLPHEELSAPELALTYDPELRNSLQLKNKLGMCLSPSHSNLKNNK